MTTVAANDLARGGLASLATFTSNICSGAECERRAVAGSDNCAVCLGPSALSSPFSLNLSILVYLSLLLVFS